MVFLSVIFRYFGGHPRDSTQFSVARLFPDVAEDIMQDSGIGNNLGERYANGEGVPEDLVEAYAWFSVSVIAGDQDGAANRDAYDLNPEQLFKGQKRALT